MTSIFKRTAFAAVVAAAVALPAMAQTDAEKAIDRYR